MTDDEMTDDETRKRDDAAELLPWWLTGKLDAGDARRVEDALAERGDLKEDAAFLGRVREEIARGEAQPSPGEFGLARLKRAIAAEERPQAASARGGTIVELPRLRRTASLWRGAAIAASLTLAVFAAGVFSGNETVLELAGASREAAGGATLTVAFNPAATEAEIRELLRALDLDIVDGPSALGLYTLHIDDAVAAQNALAQLQAQSAIVESAELDQ